METQEVLRGENISLAWAKAFLKVMDKDILSPLVVSVEDFSNLEIPEDPEIRNALDNKLAEFDKLSINTVANTIFPQSLWNPEKPKEKLYERHNNIIDSITTCDLNKYGHYFRRMIDYEKNGASINQLDHVIDFWHNPKMNNRHSALQLAMFDPARDHKMIPLKGFPCLNQISLDPYGPNGKNGLGITGFYATQYLMGKGYGNYLGLCRLGHFMAKEMGLNLVRMTCVTAKAVRGPSINKGDLRDLEVLLKQKI